MLYLTLPRVAEVMQGAIHNLPDEVNFPPSVVVRSARRMAYDSEETLSILREGGSVQIQVAAYGLVTLTGTRGYRFEPLDSYRRSMGRDLPASMEGEGLP